MIEIPRAALTADKIAEHADFFSFGTNDLTQMTFGFSRDDINTFLPDYLKQELLLVDPFQSLDTERRRPTGRDGRHERARDQARTSRCGICGEHGGDPGVDQVLPQGGLGLRQLHPVPRADRPAGGGPSRP